MAGPCCVYCTLPLEYERPPQPRPIGAMPWRASDRTLLCAAHPQSGQREFTPHRPDQELPRSERPSERTRNG